MSSHSLPLFNYCGIISRHCAAGDLSTFIHLGSKSDGDAVEEDNLLFPFRSFSQRLVHLGNVEPKLSHACDSLIVDDLDTVDNSAIEHLISLLKPENIMK